MKGRNGEDEQNHNPPKKIGYPIIPTAMVNLGPTVATTDPDSIPVAQKSLFSVRFCFACILI